MSSRFFLFFPPRDHEPPPTLRDRLNPHLSLSRRRFPVPRYAKRPDVALDAIGPISLLPTPSSPYCSLKVSENDSLRLLAMKRFTSCSTALRHSPSSRSAVVHWSLMRPGLKDHLAEQNRLRFCSLAC